jgi:hypothetical protein
MQTKTVLKKPLYDEILRITKQYVSEMEQKLMELRTSINSFIVFLLCSLIIIA